MIQVGITGQSGFIGTHLHNYLTAKKDTISVVPFEKSFFENPKKLEKFVSSCDVIVHLAAVNRLAKFEALYATNIRLVKKILDSCTLAKATPKIVFASSTQELLDNAYGKSKKDGFQLLKEWSIETSATIQKLIIPQVFGPYGKPNYNSVVATFCNQLINKKPLKIIDDTQLQLIFSNDLIEKIHHAIIAKEKGIMEFTILPTDKLYVSELKKTLTNFKEDYMDKGVFPDLSTPLSRNLFITFFSFIPASYFPKKLEVHSDNRGLFAETVRANTVGQYSYSVTKSGITRGNHYHTRKIERFVVISGKAIIKLRKVNTATVIEYNFEGSHPSFVDIPVWYTHSITNVGKGDLIALFWVNEPFDMQDADTYIENVE